MLLPAFTTSAKQGNEPKKTTSFKHPKSTHNCENIGTCIGKITRMEMEISTAHPNRKAPKRNFPTILYTMLQQLEMAGRVDVISWSPHGRTFHVHKITEFEEQILPRCASETMDVFPPRTLLCFPFVVLTLTLLI
jgi:hypothetical protein